MISHFVSVIGLLGPIASKVNKFTNADRFVAGGFVHSRLKFLLGGTLVMQPQQFIDLDRMVGTIMLCPPFYGESQAQFSRRLRKIFLPWPRIRREQCGFFGLSHNQKSRLC
jgi:hypothetical protein